MDKPPPNRLEYEPKPPGKPERSAWIGLGLTLAACLLAPFASGLLGWVGLALVLAVYLIVGDLWGVFRQPPGR